MEVTDEGGLRLGSLYKGVTVESLPVRSPSDWINPPLGTTLVDMSNVNFSSCFEITLPFLIALSEGRRRLPDSLGGAVTCTSVFVILLPSWQLCMFHVAGAPVIEEVGAVNGGNLRTPFGVTTGDVFNATRSQCALDDKSSVESVFIPETSSGMVISVSSF